MRIQDVAQNRRLARLAQLTRDLEQSRTAEDTLRTIERGFAEIDGFVASLLLSNRGSIPGNYRVVGIHLKDEPPIDVHGPAAQKPGPVLSGGILGSILRHRVPQILQNVDWSRDPFFHDTLREYTSVMAIPIAGKHLPMTWVVGLKKPPGQFTLSDLEETVERAALVGALLENQILALELARAHDTIDRDARQVGELQRALLPASPPSIAGLEIAASYEPLGRAGGDLYDLFPLNQHHPDRTGVQATPNRWCVFVGDVSGHGLAAAVVMAIVQAVLHARPPGIAGPGDLLMHVNRQLCDRKIGGFVTAFLGIYDPVSSRLTYAKAGHPPPLLVRATDKAIRTLDAVGGYPLGIDLSETFQDAAMQVGPGDTLLLYTDGITEAEDMAGVPFGIDRLMCALREGDHPPARLIERLRESVRVHECGHAAGDDKTIVAAQFLPSAVEANVKGLDCQLPQPEVSSTSNQ